MDSSTLWTVGTGVSVILAVVAAAIAVISVVSRLIADVRADMRAEFAAAEKRTNDRFGQLAAHQQELAA